MNLDEAHRKKVGEWIQQGLKLAEIQNRLLSELGITMKYIEVRLLVDDLKLMPIDPEPPRASPLNASPAPAPVESPAALPGDANAASPLENSGSPGSVSVKVDHLARPGAVASGKVTFSDGKVAEWYFDQTGRLGLVPEVPGYRPAAPDLQQFQAALDIELRKMGF